MNLTEISRQYGVSVDLLQQMIHAGVLNDLMDDIKGDLYGEKAVERLGSCICLRSLGLNVKTVKQYICLEISKKDTRNARIQILQKHRDKHLDHVHQAKQTLDCIDCVMQELKCDEND